MKKEDLEKTMPIEVLTFDVEEEPKTRASRHQEQEEVPSRMEKYNNAEDELGEEKKEEIVPEKEEISIPSEEKKEEKEKKIEKKKKSVFLFLQKLTKKQKILLLSLGSLVIILLVILLVMALSKSKPKEEGKVNAPAEESVPVIVDNYYYKDGTLHLLNSNLNEIGTYPCSNKDENLCYVAYNYYRDNFDADLVLNEDQTEKQQRMPIINNDYVFIFDNANETDHDIVLYSLQDANIIDVYLDAKAYDDHYVAVQNKSNKYGLLKIDENVEQFIPSSYEYLGKLDSEDYLVAKDSRSYFIIDISNKKVSKDIIGEIKSYSKDLIVSYVDQSYHVYDYDGNLLASSYDFAQVTDSYMALVKDNKVYVQDKEKNKYIEEGISLKNQEFVRKFIFDSEGKLTETKWSFSLKNSNEDDLEVIVYDKTVKEEEYHQLSKKTVAVNKKYDYVNYFDQYLYFYRDKEKTNLIGSYKCTNPNIIFDEDSTFSSCSLASDTIYEENEMTSNDRKATTPIINNRFVFVRDGAENVVLYDLLEKNADKAKIGPYTSVNTYTEANEEKITHRSGTVDVIALNKKGKYGMISIGESAVSSIYSFSYDAMEKLGSYVVAKDSDGKWKILFSKEEVSPEFPGKVVFVSKDKKYFKVKTSNHFALYDAEGKKVVEEEFIFLNLLGTYFIGVNKDKEVNLYHYTGAKITKKGKTITSATCTVGDLAKASYSNGVYTISLCEGDKYTTHFYNVANDTYVGEEESPKEEEPTGSGTPEE